MGVWSGRVLPFPASYIWSFSIPQSMSFRRSLRRLAVVLAFGASSIFWKATAMIIRAQMLMCDKVTLEFDRQQPIIPILYFDAENSIIHSINYVIIGAANLANKYV